MVDGIGDEKRRKHIDGIMQMSEQYDNTEW